MDRRLVLIALAVAALPLALWWNRQGPLWFEEDIPLDTTYALRGWQGGRFDLDPHCSFWPHLSFYFFLAVQLLQYLGGRMLGLYASLPDFRAAATLDPNHLRAVAMLAAVVVFLATLWAGHRLARRWLGPAGALAVVLAVALDPLFLRHSLVIAPDMLLTLFVLLGLDAARNVETRGQARDSLGAGLWMGLGAACKYLPALLAAPLLWAHARRPGGAKGWRALLDARLAACFAAAIAAFVAASPFTMGELLRGGGRIGTSLGAVVGGGGGAWRPSYLAYALQVIPADLGWPLWIGLLAALAWVALRRAREYAVLLVFLFAYAAVVGALRVEFPRYLLPAIPPLLILGVVAFQAAWAQPRFRVVAAVAATAAAAGLLVQSGVFLRVYFRPDSRALATAWIAKNIPDRAAIALEHLGPLPPHRSVFDEAARPPGVSAARRARLDRGPAYWSHDIPFVALAPEVTAEFYDPRLYLDFDAVMTSGAMRSRFLADSTRFRVQADFYRALESFFEVAYRSPPSAVGPELSIYRPRSAVDSTLARWWESRRHVAPASGPAWTPKRRATAFASRGQIFFHTGRKAAAARDWRRALEWPEAPAVWWLQYAICARDAGDWQGAREGYAAAFLRDAKLTEAGLGWAGAAARLGRRDESLNLLRELLARPDLRTAGRSRAEYLLRILLRGGRDREQAAPR